MTTLGSPGLSSQSVSRFSGRKEPKKPETDGDDKPRKSVSGFSGRKEPKQAETDWDDDKPRKPRLVIPVRFQGFLAEKDPQKPKQIGMTSPKSPGLATESVSGFSGRKKTKNPETDWDDKLGLPRVVILIRFKVFGSFWPENLETDWDDKPGLPRVVIPIHFGFFWPFSARKPRNGLG